MTYELEIEMSFFTKLVTIFLLLWSLHYSFFAWGQSDSASSDLFASSTGCPENNTIQCVTDPKMLDSLQTSVENLLDQCRIYLSTSIASSENTSPNLSLIQNKLVFSIWSNNAAKSVELRLENWRSSVFGELSFDLNAKKLLSTEQCQKLKEELTASQLSPMAKDSLKIQAILTNVEALEIEFMKKNIPLCACAKYNQLYPDAKYDCNDQKYLAYELYPTTIITECRNELGPQFQASIEGLIKNITNTAN